MLIKKQLQFEMVYKVGSRCPLRKPERKRFVDRAVAYAEAVKLSVELHRLKQPYEISVFQWGNRNVPTKVAHFAS